MATFQKDGLWIQGGQGALANVDEATPAVPGQLGRVMSARTSDGKVPRFYQYVKRYTTETRTAPVAGTAAFWQDVDDFVVTADSATALGGTTNAMVAGVWLGTKPSAGQYGFIQVGGLANVAVTGTVIPLTPVVLSGTLGIFAGIATDQSRLNPPVATLLVTTQTATGTAFSAILSTPRIGW
jgi:hypothetical protein